MRDHNKEHFLCALMLDRSCNNSGAASHGISHNALLNRSHPNIIQLYGWFHDANRIFLMLEYAGQGEVFKHLAKAGRFSEKRSSRVGDQPGCAGAELLRSVCRSSSRRSGVPTHEGHYPPRYQAGEPSLRWISPIDSYPRSDSCRDRRAGQNRRFWVERSFA